MPKVLRVVARILAVVIFATRVLQAVAVYLATQPRQGRTFDACAVTE